MDLLKFNNLNQNKLENKEKNYINKGKKIFPNLRTAILAILRGYMNGSYPEPLSDSAKKNGYYPLSDATDEEIEKINIIERQVLGIK